MSYEHLYYGLKPKECDYQAVFLMNEAINGQRKWEDVCDRLVTLKRVKRYLPCPLDDCKVVWKRNYPFNSREEVRH